MSSSIIPHLFRTEYSKIVAVLCQRFGLDQLKIAEDIASDTFLAAMETWPYQGMPNRPEAWLHQVAKNKTINYLKRHQTFDQKIVPAINENALDDMILDLSDDHIKDSQLKILFAICHPSLSEESQIGLALRILGGLSIDEIAHAFLLPKDTIQKRLQRAKSAWRKLNPDIHQLSITDIEIRLPVVLHTIYLIFSEGYYSHSRSAMVRPELCMEAMQLNHILIQHAPTASHESYALLALMCFQASRIESRMSVSTIPILYEDQNPEKWNHELIEQGFLYLQKANDEPLISKYYLEASIAFQHALNPPSEDKWKNILKLYDVLMTLDSSEFIQLNRLYALSKVSGPWIALQQTLALNYEKSHFYWVLLMHLYGYNDLHNAELAMKKALTICPSDIERKGISVMWESMKTG